MFEIRMHGRGGQGAKSAAELLVQAALRLGKQVQAYPEYGPERRGAPTRVFARISDTPITTHAPILHPDVIVIIDSTLVNAKGVIDGVKNSTIVIANSSKNPDEVKKEVNYEGKLYTVDASSISIQETGRDIPNTPMLGALVKITGIIPLDGLIEEFKNAFSGKLSEKIVEANIKGIKRAFEEVK